MTNREMLIETLSKRDWETDRYATAYIECPYHSDNDCKNPHKYGTSDFQIYCDEDCKTEWLDKEFEG